MGRKERGGRGKREGDRKERVREVREKRRRVETVEREERGERGAGSEWELEKMRKGWKREMRKSKDEMMMRNGGKDEKWGEGEGKMVGGRVRGWDKNRVISEERRNERVKRKEKERIRWKLR